MAPLGLPSVRCSYRTEAGATASLPTVTTAAMERLMEHHFPGNVRELKNLAERIIVRLQTNEISVNDLPVEYRQSPGQWRPDTATPAQPTRAQILFGRIVEHQETFWATVHEPFMSRDLTREDLRALVRGGLQATRGNYKALVELFNMPPSDYKKFLNFLRKYQANLPVQEFRTVPLVNRLPGRPRPAEADSHAQLVAG